jgi:sigma-E factor negative regulatory protein RseA
MEHISALMDSELDESQMKQHLARLKEDPELLDCWDTFHLIGDVLRGEPVFSGVSRQSVSEKLASEPTVLALRRSAPKKMMTYALSTAASLSAVAVVGWLAFFNNPLAPSPEIAAAPPNPPLAAPSSQLASVPSDGTMNEYLIAHQEYSPSTTIQGLAPYIRTVSGAPSATGQ